MLFLAYWVALLFLVCFRLLTMATIVVAATTTITTKAYHRVVT